MKIELFNDNFQNYKRYGIPKAALVMANLPELCVATRTPNCRIDVENSGQLKFA